MTATHKLSDVAENTTGNIGNTFAVRNTTESANNGGYTGILHTAPSELININTNNQLSQKAHETLSTVNRNLSVAAGGFDGLFSVAISKYITSNMTVLETGDIPNIPSDAVTAQTLLNNGLEINQWIMGSDLQFDTKVSRAAAQLFKDLSDTAAKFNQAQIDSILIDAVKADRLQIVQVKQIDIILLEGMNLYHCVYRILNGEVNELSLSERDVDRIINNIIYVTKSLERTSPLPIHTITELRNLQQNICHIRALPELFLVKGSVVYL